MVNTDQARSLINHLSWRDRVKDIGFSSLAARLHSLGIDYKTLGSTKLGRDVLIAQIANIGVEADVPLEPDGLNIYFLTMLGGHTRNVSIDIVLGLALKSRGHKVAMVLDDLSLPITEDKKAGGEARWNEITTKGYFFAKKYCKAAGISMIRLSKVIDDNAKISVAPFQSIVEASLLKHYQVGVLSEELPGLKEKVALIERSVGYSAQLGEYILRKEPNRVIMSHGIYSTWGPAFQILDQAGVDVLTYSETKKKNTEKFNWNHTADWWEVGEEWERVKDLALTTAQAAVMDDYLASRVTHEKDILKYNFGELESEEETYRRFGLDPQKPVYSLFTNVLWDAASAQREIVFDNPITWVYETIEWFADRPDLQLIVKIHPAEVVIGTNQPFALLIRQTFGELPSNVTLIEPQAEVNSWSIYKITDLGLVHTTTAGLELPLCGVPCLVVSRTHYRGKGFTIDVTTKEEYFGAIDGFQTTDSVDQRMVTKARRYAYLLFERYQMPFDLFNDYGRADVRSLKFNSLTELFEIPYFEQIVKAIETRGTFLTEA